MSVLVLASDLIGRPVVTLGGDDIGEVKDVVLGLDQAVLLGFTLRGRRTLSGPLDRVLPWSNVRAVGRDAVMIDHEAALSDEPLTDSGAGEPVLRLDVVSDAGNHLGHLRDVVIATGRPPELVGFDIATELSEGDSTGRMLLPVNEMVAVSERALVVPEAARSFAQRDLTGFGAGFTQYRDQFQAVDHARK